MTWPRRSEHRPRRDGAALPCALLACGLLPLLASCGSNGCEETRQAYCVVEMKSVSGASVAQLYVWGIGQMGQHATRIDSVFTFNPETGGFDTTVVSTPVMVDSLMLAVSSPETLELSLRPDTTETRLLFMATARTDTVTAQYFDTLTLRYDAAPYFIDMECGCSIRYRLHELEATSHLIRGASITNDVITNSEHVNIRIEY